MEKVMWERMVTISHNPTSIREQSGKLQTSRYVEIHITLHISYLIKTDFCTIFGH